METGSPQDNETGKSVPADYIEKMIFELNDVVVAEAWMGPGVAEDPLTSITLNKARSGDRVMVSWIDTRGEGGSAEAIVR
jgi:sulfur-oxidizing protein SoxZ